MNKEHNVHKQLILECHNFCSEDFFKELFLMTGALLNSKPTMFKILALFYQDLTLKHA